MAEKGVEQGIDHIMRNAYNFHDTFKGAHHLSGNIYYVGAGYKLANPFLRIKTSHPFRVFACDSEGMGCFLIRLCFVGYITF